ncbi:hypothetical protein X797_001997 [Metarhizium robertsii]|uniref:Uncharacterized protein n=1 Tax=Metarhizium robertsii TaxID=568076 RepID=A0A0A1V3A0_9HYPO|nr:hypothetical protein X797_001997 [Metarhizium robertsii]
MEVSQQLCRAVPVHVLDWCSIETLRLANFLTDQAGGEVSQGNTAQPNSNIEMQAVQAALCLNGIGYIKVAGASIGGVSYRHGMAALVTMASCWDEHAAGIAGNADVAD